jgi:hypothetical protein
VKGQFDKPFVYGTAAFWLGKQQPESVNKNNNNKTNYQLNITIKVASTYYSNLDWNVHDFNLFCFCYVFFV